jgi:hypothetical protein
MKRGIIPVCLACMMLVSMCKRDTGGDRGVIDSKREDKTVTTAVAASKKTGKIQHEAAVASEDKSKRKAQDRSTGMTKKVADRTEISAHISEGEKGESTLSDAGKELKPGGLLVKPRVDVPEVK